jgi:hypothetical protein
VTPPELQAMNLLLPTWVGMAIAHSPSDATTWPGRFLVLHAALSAATALLAERDREIDELRCEVRRLEDAP